MKIGKDIVLEYCKNIETHDIDHLQNCLDNERALENDDLSQLVGCPSAYGLEDFEGLCFIEDDENYSLEQQYDMCTRCWKQALELKID